MNWRPKVGRWHSTIVPSRSKRSRYTWCDVNTGANTTRWFSDALYKRAVIFDLSVQFATVLCVIVIAASVILSFDFGKPRPFTVGQEAVFLRQNRDFASSLG